MPATPLAAALAVAVAAGVLFQVVTAVRLGCRAFGRSAD
jgi:hypothetical protein